MSQESLYVHYYTTLWWCELNTMSPIQIEHTCCIHYRVQHWLYLHLKWLQFIFISILFGGFVPCMCVCSVMVTDEEKTCFCVFSVRSSGKWFDNIWHIINACYVCLLRCCVWGGEEGGRMGEMEMQQDIFVWINWKLLPFHLSSCHAKYFICFG